MTGFTSLRTSLIIIFVALSVGLLLASSMVQLFFNLQALQVALQNQQRLVVQDAAGQVRAFIAEKVHALKTVVTFEKFFTTSAQEQKLVLNKILGSNPSYRRVVLWDSKWSELAKVARLSEAEPLALSAHERQAIYDSASAGKDYISSVYIDPATSEPLIIVATVIADVFGDLEGVLLTEVNLKFMWDLVDQIKIGNTGTAYVVDRTGSLIAYGDITRVLARENLSTQLKVGKFVVAKEEDLTLDISRGIQGNLVVTSLANVNSPDWAVVAELPFIEAYWSLAKQGVISVLLMAVFVGIASMAGMYFSNKITRPIVVLQKAAVKIAAGDLDSTIEVKEHNEIGALAESFNHMSRDLKKSYLDLTGEKSKLIASISSIGRGFVIIDYDRKISLANGVVAKVLGVPAQAWSLETLSGELQGFFDIKTHLDKCFNELVVIEQKKVSCKDKYLDFYLAPVLTSKQKLIGAVLIIKDVTEEMVLTRSKDEFFSIASHELRTPLTAIRGNTSMMLDYYAEAFKDPELKTMLVDTHVASVRLIDIVNDFLDMSRLEQGKMQYTVTSFVIAEIIQKVEKELTENAKTKGVELKVTGATECMVTADSGKVEQILFNIIGNSLKFTETGSVTIDVAKKDKNVVVEISDTGLGIPMANQGLLFHKFQQAGSSTITRDGAKGTGLGLYISRLMAEGMGGSLDLIKSEEGKGSVFGLTLPISENTIEG